MKTSNFIFLLACIIFFTRCNKPEEKTLAPNGNSTIISVSPTHGNYNTIVTITGTGFNGVSGNDSVFLNGHFAPLISGNANQLAIQVPPLAGTGNIQVRINSNIITGPVFKYDTVYFVTTLAGSGDTGFVNGQGTTAKFNRPAGIVVDSAGTVYVADEGNAAIRKITPQGVVSTLFQNTHALHGLAMDKDGNLFATDGVIRIWKITQSGAGSVFAGTNQYGSIDGPVSSAAFAGPSGIAIDTVGNFYITDYLGRKIRKISNGMVTTIAGSGASGWADGPAATCSFFDPTGIALDKQGNIFITDGIAHNIRKLSGGMVTTFAGSTAPGYTDGTGTNARFGGLPSIYIDAFDNLIIPDTDNSRIRKVTPNAVVSNLIPMGIGNVDGQAPFCAMRGPSFITFDKNGTGYFTDFYNNNVRKIEIR